VAKFSRTGLALADPVRQPVAHVVDEQVGEQIHGLHAGAATVDLLVSERRRMTQRGTDVAEFLPAVRD